MLSLLIYCIALSSYGVQMGCTSLRLRSPTLQEKSFFLFSKNIDRAILDPAEKGPLQIVSGLSGMDDTTPLTPRDWYKRQKGLLQKDIIRAGYDDGVDDLGEGHMEGGEKGQAVLITVIILVIVVAGATIPLLIALDVF